MVEEKATFCRICEPLCGIASSRSEDVEALSGSTVLNGIPVRIEPVSARRSGAVPLAEPVPASRGSA